MASPSQPRWRTVGIGLAFWLYAVSLFTAGRWIGHHVFHGWLARLSIMGLIALGLLPWSAWLRPRIVRVLSGIGWWILVGCYFTVLIPFVLLTPALGDPLRIKRRGASGSQWLPRRPLPNTVDAAKLEY